MTTKRLTVILFILIILCGFFWLLWQAGGHPRTKKKELLASLSVKTFPAGKVVFLDEEELGVTPLLRSDLKKGRHLLKIDGLKKNIELESGALTSIEINLPFLSKLSQKSDLGWGYQVSYQKLPFLGKKSNLVALVNPGGASLFVEGERMFLGEAEQKTFTAHLKPETYLFRVEKKGFVPREVSIEIKRNYLALLEVDLAPDLYYGQEESGSVMPVGSMPKAGTNQGSDLVVSSSGWREGFPALDQKLPDLTRWNTLSFAKLFYDQQKWDFSQETEVFDYLSLLDTEAQALFGYPGLPFCYLITEPGGVYEGFGIYDFDFSSWDNLGLKPGVCRVAYLLPVGSGEISTKAQSSARALADFLAERPPLRSELLTEIGQVKLEPGEVRDFSLEFQNLSNTVWLKTEGERVFLKALPKTDLSPLYHPSWISSEEIALFEEEFVWPTQVARFNFSIQAPYLPGLFEQKLVLAQGPLGEMVLGSELVLRIEVAKEGALVVKIQETPTGFLNVRDAPSLNSGLIDVVYTGEEYLVLEKLSNWYKVLLRDGREGFIYRQYVVEV